MNKNEIKKRLRKVDVKNYRELLREYELEKLKIVTFAKKHKDDLKDHAMELRRIKLQIAILKTLAREKGIKL